MPNGRQGMGMGRRGNPPEVCVCPKCGKELPKTRGIPCRTQNCPECGTPLVGK
ncbi:MAG: hypothetical protein QHG99_02925 [Methanomicrobiales archaeon]|nr:hypothetical protein [Methanomicrobiales archaeon]